MHELAHRLVQHFLGADPVVHHAARLAAPKVREVRDHREVFVGAVVVVQHSAVSADDPAHALFHAPRAHGPLGQGIRHRLRRHIRFHQHIPGFREDHAGRQLVDPQLAVNHAVAPDTVGAVVVGVLQAGLPTEAVALGLPVHVTVVRVAVLVLIDLQARGLAVDLPNLAQGQPARPGEVAPVVGVVALGVRVGDGIAWVNAGHQHLALDVVLKPHAHVQVAALLDQAVPKHLRLAPMQVVAVGNLLDHLGDDLGHARIPVTAARAQGNVHAVGDLVAQGRIDGRHDLVELVVRPALVVQNAFVLLGPLLPATQVHALAALGLLGVCAVAAIHAVPIALPVLARHIVG